MNLRFPKMGKKSIYSVNYTKEMNPYCKRLSSSSWHCLNFPPSPTKFFFHISEKLQQKNILSKTLQMISTFDIDVYFEQQHYVTVVTCQTN